MSKLQAKKQLRSRFASAASAAGLPVSLLGFDGSGLDAILRGNAAVERKFHR